MTTIIIVIVEKSLEKPAAKLVAVKSRLYTTA